MMVVTAVAAILTGRRTRSILPYSLLTSLAFLVDVSLIVVLALVSVVYAPAAENAALFVSVVHVICIFGNVYSAGSKIHVSIRPAMNEMSQMTIYVQLSQ